ncbi:DMT family transporter [Rhodobacteraceae bacterium NNCM2]|nr:DMT family transporter [Coraliihabitans acroporae]
MRCFLSHPGPTRAKIAPSLSPMAQQGFLDGTDSDRPGMAASLMLLSLFSLSFQDSLVRLAAPDTSIWMFQVIRATGNLVLVLILSRLIWGSLPRRPIRPLAVIARSFCLLSALLFFFGGVQYLTLAEMAAGLYTFPIFVTILSALILRERVGAQRIFAVLVGATGAALILQPGSADFTLIKLMPVGAGLSYAGVVILTRRWCRQESPVTLATAVAICLWCAGLAGVVGLTLFPLPEAMRAAIPYLATGWVAPLWHVIWLSLACSVLNLASNITLAKAYQSAESSWLAPFDYSYLIFATLWGWVIFADLPDFLMILGMAMIAGAGLFTAWRENRLKKASQIELAGARR